MASLAPRSGPLTIIVGSYSTALSARGCQGSEGSAWLPFGHTLAEFVLFPMRVSLHHWRKARKHSRLRGCKCLVQNGAVQTGRACLLIVLGALGLGGCGNLGNEVDTRNHYAAEAWQEPPATMPPGGIRLDSKEASTYVYWNDLVNLVDSMYAIPGTAPSGRNIGGIVCKLVAEKINALSTRDVDDDAVTAGSRLYTFLIYKSELWHGWGPFASLSSGGNKTGAATADTQSEITRAYKLLESRYGHVQFKMPHEL